jgi:hypothetical protein
VSSWLGQEKESIIEEMGSVLCNYEVFEILGDFQRLVASQPAQTLALLLLLVLLVNSNVEGHGKLKQTTVTLQLDYLGFGSRQG